METPDLKLLKPCFIYCYLFICIKMIGFFIVNSNFQETLDRGEGAIQLESRERETISERDEDESPSEKHEGESQEIIYNKPNQPDPRVIPHQQLPNKTL